MSKRTILWILVFAAAVGLVAFLSSLSQAPEELRVGVLVPLTGGAASYGENARKGADLALKEFSASHPGLRVSLRVEDSRGEASVGLTAANKLVDLDHVVAIMGCVTSGVTLAVAPQANTWKVPLISPGGSSPNLTDAGEYVFRTWPSDVFEADAMARHIASRGIARLAILRINNEYGAAMEKSIRQKLEKATGTSVSVIAAETFEQGAREMRSQILKVKEANPEGIYFVGFPEAAVVFAKAYAEAGLSVPVFATSGFEDPQVPRDSGKTLDGTVYTKPQSNSPHVEAFRTAYQQLYGQEPGVVSDTAYDATMLILNAIAEAKTHGAPRGEALRDALLKVRDYPGASGTLSFDENGDVVKPIALFTLREGKYEPLGS
jgi:branched-chain amino acid transport system substrate-binding protein